LYSVFVCLVWVERGSCVTSISLRTSSVCKEGCCFAPLLVEYVVTVLPCDVLVLQYGGRRAPVQYRDFSMWCE